MKKIISMAFLAILPVACGSVVPTAPDMPASATAPKASATASASDKIQPPCPADSRVAGLDLKVIRRGPQEVTVRVDALIISGNAKTPPCMAPTWSVKPLARGVRITAGTDNQEATLRAPSGAYVITVFVDNGSRAGLSASLDVTIR